MNERSDLPIIDEVGAELHRLFLKVESAAESDRSPRARWRSRPWMRGRVLLPLAGLLVAASAATAAVTLSAGSKPLKGGGDVVVACPIGQDVMASTGTGLVYPGNYPVGIPEGQIRCFASQQQAVAAGYKVAPTPKGFVKLGPLYAGKPNAYVESTCAHARVEMNVPVFCPGSLPAPWYDHSSNYSADVGAPNCPGKGCEQPILGINGYYIPPNPYSNTDAGTDVSIWEISTQQESATATIGLVGCPTAKLERPTNFRGHPGGWYTCPPSQGRGETSALLQWSIGKEHYGVMVGGPPGLRGRIAQYIAAHLVEERP